MTLAELAKLLGHSDHTFLSRIENGLKEPSIHLVISLANIFQVTTDQLLKDNIDV